MKNLCFGGLGLLALIAAGPAMAADMPVSAPVYKAAPAVAVYEGGWYVWADASYQSVRLPKFDLGYRASAALTDVGAVHTYDPRATGFGVRGAIGRVLQPGTIPVWPWSNARIEIGGSYVTVKDTQSSAGATPTAVIGPVLLNGTGLPAGSTGCTVVPDCALASTLSTDYVAWSVNGKLASDHKSGSIVVSPSVEVFGGNARVNQTFSQLFTTATPQRSTYDATTRVEWDDWGAKLGLGGTVEVASNISLGVRGTVGFAVRNADLVGSDSHVFGLPAALPPLFTTTASSVAASANKTAFLAASKPILQLV